MNSEADDLPRRLTGVALASRQAANSPRRGVLWALGGRATTQIVQLVGFVALARLLTPADFGAAAVATVLTGFALLFTDLGLGAALVQLSWLRRDDVATAFWVNAVSGFLLTGLFWLCAPLFAALFDIPDLESFIRVASLTFALSLGVVQISILERFLAVRRLATLEVVASAAGYAMAVGAAAAGAGGVAIVLAPVISAGALSVLLWVAVGPPAIFPVSRSSAARLWSRGAGLVGFQVVTFLSRNVDNVILARTVSAADLGLYARAYSLMMLPVTQVNAAVARVLLPTLSRVQDDPARAGLAFRRVTRYVASVLFPATIGLACVASPLVELVLGQPWLAMAPLLTLLALSAPPQIVSGPVGSLYVALGASSVLFRRGVVLTVCTVLAVATGAVLAGTTGVALALIVRYYALFPYVMRAGLRLVHLRVRDIVREVGPAGAATSLMAAAVWPVANAAGFAAATRLVAGTMVGMVVYLVALRRLDHDVFSEGLRSLRAFSKRLRPVPPGVGNPL